MCSNLCVRFTRDTKRTEIGSYPPCYVPLTSQPQRAFLNMYIIVILQTLENRTTNLREWTLPRYVLIQRAQKTIRVTVDLTYRSSLVSRGVSSVAKQNAGPSLRILRAVDIKHSETFLLFICTQQQLKQDPCPTTSALFVFNRGSRTNLTKTTTKEEESQRHSPQRQTDYNVRIFV